MSPRVPRLREPVEQDDGRAGALLGDVHADAVGLDHPVLRCHYHPLASVTDANSTGLWS